MYIIKSSSIVVNTVVFHGVQTYLGTYVSEFNNDQIFYSLKLSLVREIFFLFEFLLF